MTKTKKAAFNLESLETRENPSRFGVNFTLPSFQFVSGQVYADANNNGAKDVGENGVNGVVVYADANNNGQRDAGEKYTTTAESTTLRSVNGVLTAEKVSGNYFFNAGSRTNPATPIRVELPSGAGLTGPVQSTVPGRSSQVIDVGLSGVTGTPNQPAAPPPSIVVTGNGSGTVTTTTGTTNSSSASVYAVAYVGPNGESFADTQASVSGNASVTASSVAVGNTTSSSFVSLFGGVFVGP